MNAQEGLELSYETLQEKYDSVTQNIDQSKNINLSDEQVFDYSNRIYRALSWLKRAEQMKKETDLAFIAYWIAFNAAYGEDKEPKKREKTEKKRIKLFLDRIVDCSLIGDNGSIMQDMLDNQTAEKVEFVLKSIHINQDFWNKLPKNHNYKDVQSIDEIEENARERLRRGLSQRIASARNGDNDNLRKLLKDVFNNLYTLRNQIMHGSATFGSSANRPQIEGGLAVIAYLLPRMINVMLEHSNPTDYPHWGRLAYPLYKKDYRDKIRNRTKDKIKAKQEAMQGG